MTARPYQLPDASITLLTGATGMLGQELLYQLLEDRTDRYVLVLARAGKDGTAQQRIEALLSKHFTGAALEKALQHTVVVEGDVTEPNLGLDLRLWDEIASRTTEFIHSAANVRFDNPLEVSRRFNLEGTRELLKLARASQAARNEIRFNHVSTAYRAGKASGLVYEDELTHSRGFHNSYEQSKYETEHMLHDLMGELPITILRPSIIIGNSRTGETGNFNAFYWVLRAIANNQLKLLPANPKTKVDLVPVDYVASGVIYLGRHPDTIGKTYHLTVGPDKIISVRSIARAAVEFFNFKRIRVIPPHFRKVAEGPLGRLLLDDRTYNTLKRGSPYFPYLEMKMVFDNQHARELLEPAGIEAPFARKYFETLFQFCLATDWGRKPLEKSAVEPAPAAEEQEAQILVSGPK